MCGSIARVMRKANVDHPRPFGIVHFDDAACAAETRVVDQHIDACHPRFGIGDQGADLFLDRYVAQAAIDFLQAGLLTQRLNGLGKPLLVDVGDEQRAAAFFRTTLRGGKADAGARCGRDQHRFAGKQAMARHVGRRGPDCVGFIHDVPRGSLGMPSPRSAMMLS
jgi:hypothetical protein